MGNPRAEIDIVATTGRFNAKIGGVQDLLLKVRNRMRSVTRAAKIMLLAQTAALAGVIKEASDAQESLSKFEAVFKNQSAAALEWAETTALSTNRAKETLIEFLAAMQDTFVPFGFARDQARLLSQTVTQLAVDIASFNNSADAEVLNSLQSALVGNVEAVRKYGIVITQTVLSQELLNRGIAGGAKNASEQEKVMARLALILRFTSDAQGDAARTAGSFENQLKGMLAQVKSLAITIGNIFLPMATRFVAATKNSIVVVKEWAKRNELLIATMVALSTVGGLSIVTLLPMASMISNIVASTDEWIFVLGKLRLAFLALAANPFALALIAIAGASLIAKARVLALTEALKQQEQQYEAVAAANRDLQDALKTGELDAQETARKKLIAGIREEIEALERLRDEGNAERRDLGTSPDVRISPDLFGDRIVEDIRPAIAKQQKLLDIQLRGLRVIQEQREAEDLLAGSVEEANARMDEQAKAQKRIADENATIEKTVQEKIADQERQIESALTGTSEQILLLRELRDENEKLAPLYQQQIDLLSELDRIRAKQDSADKTSDAQKALQAQADALRKQLLTKQQIIQAEEKHIALVVEKTDLTEKEGALLIARLNRSSDADKEQSRRSVGIESLRGALSRISNAAATRDQDRALETAKNTKLTAEEVKRAADKLEELLDGQENLPSEIASAMAMR